MFFCIYCFVKYLTICIRAKCIFFLTALSGGMDSLRLSQSLQSFFWYIVSDNETFLISFFDNIGRLYVSYQER